MPHIPGTVQEPPPEPPVPIHDPDPSDTPGDQPPPEIQDWSCGQRVILESRTYRESQAEVRLRTGWREARWYEIVSGSARLLDIGDTAHSSVLSLAEPDWTLAGDSDASMYPDLIGRKLRP